MLIVLILEEKGIAGALFLAPIEGPPPPYRRFFFFIADSPIANKNGGPPVAELAIGGPIDGVAQHC